MGLFVLCSAFVSKNKDHPRAEPARRVVRQVSGNRLCRPVATATAVAVSSSSSSSAGGMGAAPVVQGVVVTAVPVTEAVPVTAENV